MDVENLNKNQLVLLTLLVTFVSSVATSILVVSLLDESAPPTFSQTINKVVERTIEKAIPVPGKPGVERTVIIREQDIVTKTIADNRPAIIPIYSHFKAEDGTEQKAFVGRGVMLSGDGLIATWSGLVTSNGVYSLATEDGKIWSLKILSQNEKRGVALLQAIKPEAENKYVFRFATIADSNFLQLGQSAIAIGGGEGKTIAVGTISYLGMTKVEPPVASSTAPIKENSFVSLIDISALPKGEKGGGALLSTSGDLIGVALPQTSGEIMYAPSNFLKDEITALQAPSKELKKEEKKAP
ncbi:MAG: serine protease [Patescibacteria group bacterium]